MHSSEENTLQRFRVLSLDGGGAKGFYTLGVLREVEGLVGKPLHQCFDLVFGTSTGAIIAALIGLGRSVDDIHAVYREHVLDVVAQRSVRAKTLALQRLAADVFGDAKFDAVQTAVGVVTTKWIIERPMIFKGDVRQAHGRVGTFAPGFGCTIADVLPANASVGEWIVYLEPQRTAGKRKMSTVVVLSRSLRNLYYVAICRSFWRRTATETA